MDERRTSPLHGRRVGKPLSGRQKELVATLLPELAVDVSSPIDIAALFERATPSPRFVDEAARVYLEVGFGAGEHLVAEAEREKGVSFIIGCEPFLNGMAHALAKIADRNLSNIRLHLGDAGEVIDKLPESCLDRVSILYPDPWPKRRQRKRRFIGDNMLERLAVVMKSGAELRFATDIDDLCGWTLACLARSPHFVWTAARADDWRVPWAHWEGTRYERKAIEQGRRPCYLTARRR